MIRVHADQPVRDGAGCIRPARRSFVLRPAVRQRSLHWVEYHPRISIRVLGHSSAAQNADHPLRRETRAGGPTPDMRHRPRRHWRREIAVSLIRQSEQLLASVLSGQMVDPDELCEVFATVVVDRRRWGSLYRVHRRRRWRRGGPDGPPRAGSGQIVLTGLVLRRLRHHLSRAALQRPSPGYDRTCPDVPTPTGSA